MRRIPSRRTVLALAGAVALLAAGCSGSDGDADSGVGGSPTTAAPTAAAETTAATATGSSATTTEAPATTVARSSSSATTGAPGPTAATAAPAVAAAAPAAGTTAITVESTAAQYFVLYVTPDPAAGVEVPVAVTRGRDGTTRLTDGRAALPESYYRVATFQVAAPGDVDGDGIDDLTELDDPGANPLNAAPAMTIDTGAVLVPDAETYRTLSYQGSNVGRDDYLAGLEVMKFIIVTTDPDRPAVYFMNTNNYNAHPRFAQVVGLPNMRGPAAGVMRGDVVYEPDRTAADGTKGVYRFAFQPNDAYSFDEIALAYELLTTNMPFLEGDLSYYAFPNAAYPLYVKQKAAYDAYRVAVIKGDA